MQLVPKDREREIFTYVTTTYTPSIKLATARMNDFSEKNPDRKYRVVILHGCEVECLVYSTSYIRKMFKDYINAGQRMLLRYGTLVYSPTIGMVNNDFAQVTELRIFRENTARWAMEDGVEEEFVLKHPTFFYLRTSK